ncbi:uncharacterized protein CTHT_0031050 [Thermochaetoides thermophila DSM 1495]|uniref:Cytochrome b561 domain-containing protein n=1 Tax=Chaetomium thermophilum (strain DSM 1495 / CBS 144.50 / IMI 039719) TaxID=759272 RepID=G0S482_CHATD|nr:hypothetical protein CTHT_0031050 [Thermochaetoides thermophila DSM 1495]EGS21256.1 hypothetical protein CTHT_0031050 [Thermochaetoides thermophila DSM 1495]
MEIQIAPIRDTNTTIAINLTPGTHDINFYVTSPDWYQYVAIGIGNAMEDALILVMGHTEPFFDPNVKVTVHYSAVTENLDIIVHGTCHSCHALAASHIEFNRSLPLIWAVGPSLSLESDDLDAPIRRHISYGKFTVDAETATGSPPKLSEFRSADGKNIGVLFQEDEAVIVDRRPRNGIVHGVLYAIAALALAPIDFLVAGLLAAGHASRARKRTCAWTHYATATVYTGFVFAALVPGMMISRDHIRTRKYTTPHQIIGLITVALMGSMFIWGLALLFLKRSATKRNQALFEVGSKLKLSASHRWVSRIVWLLLLINIGLGLKLAEHRPIFILGYVALAGGMVVVLVPIYFCVWWCARRRRKEETETESHELPVIYDNYHR